MQLCLTNLQHSNPKALSKRESGVEAYKAVEAVLLRLRILQYLNSPLLVTSTKKRKFAPGTSVKLPLLSKC